MCEVCSSVAAALNLGHAVKAPLVAGGPAFDQITVLPLDDTTGEEA